MLVNLMPPVLDAPRIAPTLRDPVIVTSPGDPVRGFLVVHPRYRNWLAKCGITSAKAALNLPGEIVSGHANRHVLQVAVKSGTGTRSLFLKREHTVSWRVRLKNWRDGFGRVSRSEREAKVLDQLERAGLPGPHWVAYGEDGAGRAFLLVDELTGYRELRDVLSDTALSVVERGTLAARLGEALAELHDAGFDTPDLAAKHVFVRPGSFSAIVLDWQSAKPGRPLDTMTRLQSLASLNASLVEWLATPRERLRMLRAYLRAMRQRQALSPPPLRGRVRVGGESVSELKEQLPGEVGDTPHPNPPPQGGRGQDSPAFTPFARTIVSHSRKRLKRSSIRVQRQPNAVASDQRLVWLAEEAVCAIPEIAKLWPTPALAPPYYAAAVEDGERLGIRLADNRPATLIRFRTSDPLGRVWSTIRGKSWRSPAARFARILFHLQNAGVDVPQLYAFGQRLDRHGSADSFLVHGLPDGTPTLDAWLLKNEGEPERMLTQLGGILRTVHDVGCVLGASPNAIRVVPTRGRVRLLIEPTHDGKLLREVSQSQRVRDLAGLLRALPASALATTLDAYANGDAVLAKRLRKQVAA